MIKSLVFCCKLVFLSISSYSGVYSFKLYTPSYFLIHEHAHILLCLECVSSILFSLCTVVAYNFVVIYPCENSLSLCDDFV